MASQYSPKDLAFQALINLVGTDNLLAGFANFLGRDNMAVKLDSNRTGSNLPAGFTGIAFSGAHWKGYENKAMTYDSYTAGVQAATTMNYCQSYACFMWASRGLVNATRKAQLKAGKGAENVQTISKLWLAYFAELMSIEKGKWLKGECASAKVDLQSVIGTLTNLSKDAKLAGEFADSKL